MIDLVLYLKPSSFPRQSAERKECAGADFTYADTALNATYRKITSQLKKELADAYKTKDEYSISYSKNRLETLVAAQRAWVAFRDANCTAMASENFGGTLAGLQSIGCETEMTKARTDELKSYYLSN